MKKNLLLFSAFLVLLLTSVHIFSQTRAIDKLPDGKWTLSAGPYMGSDWNTIPVDVESVSTNMRAGGAIEKVVVRNYAESVVVGVRLKWRLSRYGRNVADGESRELTTLVNPGATAPIHFPIVNFAQLSRPFVKSGFLEGEYRIDVLVSYIEYGDGSRWKTGYPGRIPPPQAEGGGVCPNQKCHWAPAEGGGGAYVCAPGDGTLCAVAMQGQQCTETRCIPGGDRPVGLFERTYGQISLAPHTRNLWMLP